MNKRILLIESNSLFGRAVKYKIETILASQVLWFKNNIELEKDNIDFKKIDIALVEYNMPESDNSAIIHKCHDNCIPTVILTPEITNDIQEKIWSFKILDYALKGYDHSVDNIITNLRRFFNNPVTGILVVDNSMESRNHLKELLKLHQYAVYEASTEKEAMEILNKNRTISLVITDHFEPELDGLKLTRDIRSIYPLDRLAIIGISAHGNHSLKIQFIKSGANDFLTKPFISELLFCRISQNLKIVEYFHQLKELALLDQLTKLNNRHFLRETGQMIFENAKRNGVFLVIAMIDIDNFKKVNDTYGHDAGDLVLKKVASILQKTIRKSDLAIRYGGEEFVIVANNFNPKNALNFFNKLRIEINNTKIELETEDLTISVSIGICLEKLDRLEDMINRADEKMYKAKTTGKNRVCV